MPSAGPTGRTRCSPRCRVADTPRSGAAVQAFAGGLFAENTYLVTCGATGSAVLVDPGAATPQALAAAARQGARVEAVLLTHAHVDHVEGLALAVRETGAPVHLHPADLPLYGDAPAQGEMFGLRLEPLPPVDRELAHGDSIPFGECTLAVRFAPGHAPGHVVFVADGWALVGDTVFQGSIGRTDLPGGDLGTLLRSIRQQVLTLPDPTVLYNGHGPQTTVGRERAANPFLVPGFETRYA
jgi:hydroxyacylglutathione hydrolase